MMTTDSSSVFRLGLIVNPLAGLGGPLGMKGSDDLSDRDKASDSRALPRCRRSLAMLQQRFPQQLEIVGFDGVMAGDLASELGIPFLSVGAPASSEATEAADTGAAARAIHAAGVDLLLFVGGDGTARDICGAVGTSLPVLGIPAGVKMHSGVYATSPESAAELVTALINGDLVDIGEEEVRDIDEAAFRRGQVRARHYGELWVPRFGQFLQRVKDSGREVESLVLAEIADDLIETMEPDCLYLIGPGSTTAAVMTQLGLDNTLLGFDAVADEQLLGSDLSAVDIGALLDSWEGPVKAVLTVIPGQGHLLGRGNQQLTPELLRRIGRDNLIVLATKSKLAELQGRPLLLDSNDPELDEQWSGFIPVITAYRDAVMYRVQGCGVGVANDGH